GDQPAVIPGLVQPRRVLRPPGRALGVGLPTWIRRYMQHIGTSGLRSLRRGQFCISCELASVIAFGGLVILLDAHAGTHSVDTGGAMQPNGSPLGPKSRNYGPKTSSFCRSTTRSSKHSSGTE